MPSTARLDRVFRQKRFSLAQVTALLAAAFTLTALVARAVEVPNTFVAGTTISSGEMNANFDALAAAVTALEAQVESLQATVDANAGKLAHVSVVEGSLEGLAGPHLIVEGANLHVRSGAGSTDEGGCGPGAATCSGLGNLVIGYNELGAAGPRTGANGLVIGSGHTLESPAALVAGRPSATLEVAGTVAALGGTQVFVGADQALALHGGNTTTVSGASISVSAVGSVNVTGAGVSLGGPVFRPVARSGDAVRVVTSFGTFDGIILGGSNSVYAGGS